MKPIDALTHEERRARVQALVGELFDLLHAPAAPLPSTPHYVTAKTCPAGARAFKRAIASGLKVIKLGRSPALRAVDFDAWLSSGAQPACKVVAPVVDDHEADRDELRAAGVQLRPAANDGRRRAAGRGTR